MITRERLYEESPWNLRMESLRVLRGLERKELAELIGVSIWNYNSWARGDHYPIKTYRERISLVLGIPLEEIFEGKKEGVEPNAAHEAAR